VKLVLKDFPLNADCNSSIGRTLHPAACDAAVAVRLAAQHNRAEALEDWLYTHQPDMTGPSVRTWANEKGGVSEAEFSAKYAATLALVKGDIALGNQLHVQSTPTFFINGVKVEGGLPPQYFDQAIANELQRAMPK
jgi:protein-disulfide isomerase